jgi:hypothetical protein
MRMSLGSRESCFEGSRRVARSRTKWATLEVALWFPISDEGARHAAVAGKNRLA